MSFPTYAHYKDSGVEWLGEVPAHWDVVPLKQVISKIESGTSVNAIDTPASGDELGVLKTSCVYRGEFDPSENKAIVAEEYDRAACPVTAGTLIVSRMNTPDLVGAAGVVKKTEENIFLPDRLWQVHFRDANPSFIHFWCNTNSYRAQVEMACAGASSSMQNLAQDQFRSFFLPKPALVEQDQITEFLTRETTKLDALIIEQRTLIDLLKEKRQAVISHAVTKGLDPRVPMKDSGVEWLGEVPAHWAVTKAGRYLSILPGYAFPSTEFSLDEANTKLLRGINVGVSKIKWDETVYWRRFDGDGLDVFELADGDIVIGMDRPYISEGMRVARISEADLPCLLLQRVAAIRASGKLSDDHILLLLSSNMFLDHFSPETTGVSVPHISPSQIAEFIIPIPPLEEQKDIFKWVEVETTRIDALTAEAQTTIALLQERRSALISAAVTGKIDVRQAA